MADRTNLEILLSEWGHWQLAQAAMSLGFPGQAPFSQMRVDGQRRSDPDAFLIDDDIRRVDVAIGDLHPDARVVVAAHYIWPGPVKDKTDRLEMSKAAFYFKLDAAHDQLSHRMNGKYSRGYEPILSRHLEELSR